MKDLSDLRRRLNDWYARHARSLPWRRTRDPYRIWVSEIMLQQTRVAAALPYYERFLERFPDLASLARAPESDLLAAWSGLGYYTRARNLQRAARDILALGAFPRDYDALRALPGVGDYTAAAIASIAFHRPHAVVDGNVVRVLTRLANDPSDVRSIATRRRLREVAEILLDRARPGAFNQALMELGATVCLPQRPDCAHCPIAAHCEAHAHGTESQLPVKLRRASNEQSEKTVLIVRRKDQILLRQRTTSPNLGFWELPDSSDLPRAALQQSTRSFRHTIMNRTYLVTVCPATVRRAPAGFEWRAPAGLPLTTITRKALQ
jgi:A/G-specific adenine glycosylase